MTVHVYNLRLRTTRLASILRGVWLIAITPGAAGWGEGGGGGGGGGGASSPIINCTSDSVMHPD